MEINNQDSYRELIESGAARIKVIGVGGGGNNAINRMVDAGIKSAEFISVNTDKQILYLSRAHQSIQIGEKLTKGLGAGAEPSVGERAAEESREELKEILKDVDLLFITAGMGGGTGTGAAPVIASLSRELGILTVAVVTKPFNFEGKKRMTNAIEGIQKLSQFVDTLLVIPNEKLLQVAPKGTPIVEAFKQADEVLRKGIQGITDLIVTPALINLDFADVRSIMKDKGLAHMGIGEGVGDNKTIEAVKQAVSSPLLDSNIQGATGVILNITGGLDLSLDEVNEACTVVSDIVDRNANIIFGAGIDNEIEGKVYVTLIATGFPNEPSTMSAKPLQEENPQQPQNQAHQQNVPYNEQKYNSQENKNEQRYAPSPQPTYQQDMRNDRGGYSNAYDREQTDRNMQQQNSKPEQRYATFEEEFQNREVHQNNYQQDFNTRDRYESEPKKPVNNIEVDESDLPAWIRKIRNSRK